MPAKYTYLNNTQQEVMPAKYTYLNNALQEVMPAKYTYLNNAQQEVMPAKYTYLTCLSSTLMQWCYKCMNSNVAGLDLKANSTLSISSIIYLIYGTCIKIKQYNSSPRKIEISYCFQWCLRNI